VKRIGTEAGEPEGIPPGKALRKKLMIFNIKLFKTKQQAGISNMIVGLQ
jgi:hypothetical protein